LDGDVEIEAIGTRLNVGMQTAGVGIPEPGRNSQWVFLGVGGLNAHGTRPDSHSVIVAARGQLIGTVFGSHACGSDPGGGYEDYHRVSQRFAALGDFPRYEPLTGSTAAPTDERKKYTDTDEKMAIAKDVSHIVPGREASM